MNLINLKDVCVDFGAAPVLDNLTLGVDGGQCIGIVGENGTGKSTLLRVLAGQLPPQSGSRVARGGLKVGLLAQADALADDQTVHQVVLGATPEHLWRSDRRVRAILQALLDPAQFERPLGELSGGQRRKVDLARLLIADYDVLLLDEPTNHLDMVAIDWLAQHLRQRFGAGPAPNLSSCASQSDVAGSPSNRRQTSRTGSSAKPTDRALLVVTHDRWFLDAVATQMWELYQGRIQTFEGGFSAYIQQRAERAQAAQTAETKRQNLLRRELAWLSRGARARSSKPKFHVKAARELVATLPPRPSRLELRRASVARLGKQVYKLEDVSLSFDGRPVLDHLDWTIGPGERLALLGPNGSGKTTLLSLLSGRLKPTSGRLRVGKTVQAATLSQRLTELQNHTGERVRELLTSYRSSLLIDGEEVALTYLLEQIGFPATALNDYVGNLSGGQKHRLQLLLTLAREPNVLLLDEPGNDMDVDMLAAMEDLLDSWPGTLILVSHDRYLVERTTDDQYLLAHGHLRHLPGGTEQYVAESNIECAMGAVSASHPATTKVIPPFQRGARRAGVVSGEHDEPPALSNVEQRALKKQLASTERKLKTAESKLAAAKEALAATDPYDYEALMAAQSEVDAATEATSALEDTWLSLSLRLGL